MKNKSLENIKSTFFKRIEDDFVRNSKAFCMMPWIHLHITQYGTVTPCCQAPWDEANAYGNINQQTLEEIWNGEKIKAFRKKLLKDMPDSRCAKCYHLDKSGALSLRQSVNRLYQDKLSWVKATREDGSSDETRPIYWDIRFSNICNLRCRICGPWSSSRWYDDALALGDLKEGEKVTHAVNDFEKLKQQLAPYLDSLEEIYFAGGEPLIMDEHYKLLDWFLENKKTDVLLRYNTNFSITKYKGSSIFDYWKQFNNVLVFASLDDSYKRGELQRKDQVWNEAVENRKLMMKECPDVHFSLSPTISVFNVFHLPEFHKEWVDLGLIDVKDIWPNVLEEPGEYNINILPAEMKKQVAEIYKNHIHWMRLQASDDEELKAFVSREFENCMQYMNAKDRIDLIPEFINRCKALDKLRDEKTEEIIPELSALFDQYNQMQEMD